MLAAFALVAVCSQAPVSPLPSAAAVRDDSLAAIYAAGIGWDAFFAGVKARRNTWQDNYERGAVIDSALVDRARAAGTWRLLVVAEDWCGDSANTVPYLARLVEQVPGLELRIVNSTRGRQVMDRFPTGDGRSATPTIVLLDAADEASGCFVERPGRLKAWIAEHKPKLSDDEFQKQRIEWQRTDAGVSTLTEFVAILEGAARGSPVCDR